MDYSSIQQDLEEVPDGEVYFIFEKNDDDYCKIGRTIHHIKRPKQLRTGNRRQLYIYKALKGYCRLETMLHKYFKEYRVKRTEWFNITFTDVDDIIEQYNDLQAENEQISEDELEEENNISDEELIGEIELIEETETKTTVITKKKLYKAKKEVQNYKCEKCEKGFKENRYLQVHLKRKIACDKKHLCVKCEKEFASNSALSAHLNRIKSCSPNLILAVKEDNTKNKCHICGNTYSTPSSLKRHQREVCSKDQSKIDLLISLVMEMKEENKILRQQSPLPSK